MSLTEPEIERAAGFLEDAHDPLGFDLDDLYAEDDAAIDFASEPVPVEGLDQIDRRFCTLRRAERKLAEYDRVADARRAELELRITQGRRPLLEKAGYWRRSLELAHQALIAVDPRRTRVQVPNGTLTSQAGGVEWEYPAADTEAEGLLLAYVRDRLPEAYVAPSVVEVPARVAKVPLKAALKDLAVHKVDGVTVPLNDDGTVLVDGVPLPGVRVKPKPRTYVPQPAGLDDLDAF